jgi:excisionase family DNA binding protein
MMDTTLALYRRFEAVTGDPVAASNLTLAHAMLQQQASVLTVPEAAARLKVSEKKIYRMCQAGEIDHYRVGDAIRIKPDALDDIKQPAARRVAKWV